MRAENEISNDTLQPERRIANNQYSILRIGDNLNSILEEVNANVSVASGTLYDLETCRLALASVFQLNEEMDDETASEATRARSDWRYTLYFPQDHPGIPAFRFCEFRQHLYASDPSLVEFSVLLRFLYQYGLPGLSKYAILDPKAVLISTCKTNWHNHLLKALKNALGYINSLENSGNQSLTIPLLSERYSSTCLPISTHSEQALDVESDLLGRDIGFLLAAIKSKKGTAIQNSREIRYLDFLFTGLMEFHADIYAWKPTSCSNCVYYSGIKGGELLARIH